MWEIKEGSALHYILCRIAAGDDIRKLKVHPLWCNFLDRLDIELRDKLNSFGKECKDAALREPLLVDTNISSIKWNPDIDGYLNAGDYITVTNVANQSQNFYLRESVSINDTSLKIRTTNVQYIFLENDLVCRPTDEVYRRWDQNLNSTIISVDLPLPDPEEMPIEELVKSHTLYKNGQRLVPLRKLIAGQNYGYTINNNNIILGIAPQEGFDVFELYIKNPHLYA